MSTTTKTAPAVIRCRNGKLAKLDTEPHYNEFNDAWLVVYENDQIRFSLFWPSMTYHSDSQEHGLDAVDEDPRLKMRPIRVCFADPAHNYETTVNGTRQEIEAYFVGNALNVGNGGNDDVQTPVRVEFLD